MMPQRIMATRRRAKRSAASRQSHPRSRLVARRRFRVVHAYLRLPHAVPILVVMAATAGFAAIAADGWPATATFVELLMAMLFAQLVIGTVNELVDAETDALVKPSKPIPAGLV